MSDDRTPSRDDRRKVLRVPLLIWLALVALAAASLGYAYLPGAPVKPLVALLIFVGMAVVVGTAFMRLPKASGLIRFTAAVGLVWLSFLFLMSFADLLTR